MHEPHRKTPASTWLLLGLVMANIALQLINANLIKFASIHLHTQTGLVAAVLLVVLGLAGARFAVWGAMHKRYPVSIAYPASALFFPCLVVSSWAWGEAVSAPQIAGAMLVTLGVIMLIGGGTTGSAKERS